MDKGKSKQFTYGREVDHYDKNKIAIFWNQELRGLTIGDFLGSIRKDIQEEILDKLKCKKLVKNENGTVVGMVFTTLDDVQEETDEWEELGDQEDLRMRTEVTPTKVNYQAYVRTIARWSICESLQ